MLLIGRWNQGKIVAKRFHWYLYHGGNIKAVFDQEPVFDGELKILEMNFAWWVILLNLQTCIWWDVFCNRVSNFERGQCNVWNWDCFKGWAKLSCLRGIWSKTQPQVIWFVGWRIRQVNDLRYCQREHHENKIQGSIFQTAWPEWSDGNPLHKRHQPFRITDKNW